MEAGFFKPMPGPFDWKKARKGSMFLIRMMCYSLAVVPVLTETTSGDGRWVFWNSATCNRRYAAVGLIS